MTTSRLMMLFPLSKFVIIDLFPNCSLAYIFLSAMFGTDQVQLVTEHDSHSFKDFKENKSRCLIIPPWLVKFLNDNADVVINTMSFQHMNINNLIFYDHLMNHAKVKYLYQVNRTIKKDLEDITIANQPWVHRSQVLHQSNLFPNTAHMEQFSRLS